MELHQIEWYSEVQLDSTLNEGVASNSLAALVVKTEQTEGVFVVHVENVVVVDMEEIFFGKPKEHIHVSTFANTLSTIFLLSYYAKDAQATLAF